MSPGLRDGPLFFLEGGDQNFFQCRCNVLRGGGGSGIPRNTRYILFRAFIQAFHANANAKKNRATSGMYMPREKIIIAIHALH